jgi:hypothetical protein
MLPPVHILATIRQPALWPATTLVFKTLRTGFPTAPVMVWGNGLKPNDRAIVIPAAEAAGAGYQDISPTSHDAWIETLINTQSGPLWICDTDMVFFDRLTSNAQSPKSGRETSDFRPETLFAGRYEPAFDEEWTGTRHVERLHTCLMYLNPPALRSAIRAWQARIPSPWRDSAQFPLVRQHFVPVRGGDTLFYDTMAGLWHAGLGTPFTPEQDAAFEHLHCATYADLVDAPSLANLKAVHNQVYANPQAARGLKQAQDQYYIERNH